LSHWGQLLFYLFLFLLLAIFPSLGSIQASSHIGIIYVDANTGGASGGHVALKIGHNVFHYQQDQDGYLRLKRDTYRHFLLIYNHIENRSLYLAQTAVSEELFQKADHRFSRLLLAQERNFNNLAALKKNYRFLKSIGSGSGKAEVQIEALGLFETGDVFSSQDMERLRQGIIKRFGKRFFSSRLSDLDRRIARLDEKEAQAPVLPRDRKDFVPMVHTFYERLTDIMAMKLALDILNRGTAVRSKVLMDAGGPMPECFNARLKAFGHDVIDSVVSLLSSNRPDSGVALLVQMARLQAIERSLRTGRLMVLDPFPDDAVRVERDVFMEDRERLSVLESNMRKRLTSTITGLCGRSFMDELSYNGLENLAARLVELEKGFENGVPVRISDRLEIPCRIRRVVFKSAREVHSQAVKEAKKRLISYSNRMKGLYSYRLLTANCVTELLGELEQLISHKDVFTEGRLRGFDPGYRFIPVMFFDWWVSHAKHCNVICIPSYRKKRLLKMYLSENDLKVYLREFNTISSTIYKPSLSDSSFLIFTDDAFFLRPLFGALNVVWSLFPTASGLVSMPFDGAKRFKYGFWGIVYSVPEILFVNIRKGSFCWTGEED